MKFSDDMATAMRKACVLEPDLQQQLEQKMAQIRPLPSIYDPDFIAANQADRANHLIGGTRQEQLEQIRRDIR